MSRFICPVCGKAVKGIGNNVGACPDCIRNRWKDAGIISKSIHDRSRILYQLPLEPPSSIDGYRCSLCLHKCSLKNGERGFCGIRKGKGQSFRKDGRKRALVSYYDDPIPTNCVADWVCPAGTGAGHPAFCNDEGPEVGYYNLAVFFEACNFNCLYCQNWSFKRNQNTGSRWRSIDALVGAVGKQTSCVCFFGGDPTPQLPYAIRVSERMREVHPHQVLRICWETNASMHPAFLKRMARISLESGGCIKVDLKAWNPNLHRALCGCDNRLVLENFARLSRWASLRPFPDLLVASTLLVPGYVGEEEVWNIASFIAGLNPDIPYTLLAFAPEFCLNDFPTTSHIQAKACLDAARRAGLRRVNLGNRYLIGAKCV